MARRSSNGLDTGDKHCKATGGEGAEIASIVDETTQDYVLSSLTTVDGWYSARWVDREIYVYGSTNVPHDELLSSPKCQLLNNTSGTFG